jgi:hypothetical protein
LDAIDAARGAITPVGGQLSREQFGVMALAWLQKAPACQRRHRCRWRSGETSGYGRHRALYSKATSAI